MNAMLQNDEVVQALSRSLARGIDGLGNVPSLIISILQSGAWRDRQLGITGETIHFDRFEDFVVTPPLAGLGAQISDLERVCRDNTQALSLLDRALRRRRGRRPRVPDMITSDIGDKAPTGNSRRSALRRLERQRPDLYTQVLSGDLTAHRAAVLAGFRPETFTVVHDVNQIERALRQRLSPIELKDLAQRIIKCTQE